MKVGAILQARMGSTRLPKKVLLDIAGVPLLHHVVERLKRAVTLESIIIATTFLEEDKAIVDVAKMLKVPYFIGSSEDVLERFVKAAQTFNLDIIVRATADNPLVDPHLMDEVVKKHIEVKADYTYMKELPLGVATEAISRESLERVASLGKSPHHREHVTTYFKENPSEFNFQVLEPPSYLRRPDLRLTVDTKEDLALMREIYKRLYTPGKMISVSQVIKLLDENPQLRALNIHIKQRVF